MVLKISFAGLTGGYSAKSVLGLPELVTMEEMNVPAVSQMLRLMAHNARKFGTAATVWKWHDLS